MTTRDFTANVISASKVVPDGNFKDSKASGVWDINEALDLIKGGNWPNAANVNPSAFVDALFQTHLYTGTGSSQTITNGIDLSGSGSGGLVWIKDRDVAYWHNLADTARGANKMLSSNSTNAEASRTQHLTAFNNNGFTIGTDNDVNYSGSDLVSWTFRKQPKFFDIVTYTGNNTARTISHNLGSVPGMIIIKRTDSSDIWYVYHRSIGEGKRLKLNATDAESSDTDSMDNTAPTSTVFTIGANVNHVNADGGTFVAYLFAHNDDDGGFGEPGDQDIIKCGSYTGNSSGTGPVVDLGFEPQWLLVKDVTNTNDWFIWDVMRGFPANVANSLVSLNPNTTDAEQTEYGTAPQPTGFQVTDNNAAINTNNSTYIYMAIRRGGMQTPTAASDVFAINIRSSSDGEGKYTSGFPVDFSIAKVYDDTGNFFAGTRLINAHLQTNDNVTSGTSASDYEWDHNDGVSIGASGAFFGSSKDIINYMWKRARGYFDVVAYTGNGSNRTISHNLGVAPEMMWVKKLSVTNNWKTFHSNLGGTKSMELNTTVAAETNGSSLWNSTAPTSSVLSLGTAGDVNGSSATYIAYLFATVAGVSKVGSYTGNDGSTNVDCGFTNGASFIMIKKTNGTGDWFVLDSTRGLGTGNTPTLKLNTTEAEDDLGARDIIDPLSSGFTVNANRGGVNDNGDDFIFYAIAATS